MVWKVKYKEKERMLVWDLRQYKPLPVENDQYD